VAHGAWFARLLATDGSLSRVLGVESERYPDDSIQDFREGTVDDELLAGWRTQVRFTAGRPTHLDFPPDLLAKAPPLWFVEYHEDEATPPNAAHLIIFTAHEQETGRLLDRASFELLGIPYPRQLAAMRWYPATGRLHQMYVQPAWRRLGLGTVLIYATGTLSVAHGWPRVWAKGPRTEMGEKLRNASPLWINRTDEVSEFVRPMTPGEAS
jgi:GNAT superfamily N-acetyltransferase